MTLVEEYLSSLKELTGNSRPQINMLTMLADDNYAIAPSIAYTIEAHIESLRGGKLFVFYLIDSIVKNVRKGYVELFARNLPTLFAKMFAESDANVRASLYKLRTTWDGVFPKERLAWLDTLVNKIDPNWPVVRSNIHVNPEFIRGGPNRSNIVKEDMREKILEREILELERKKVELELRHTKEVLEKEQKKLESFTMNIKGGNKSVSVLLADSSSLAPNEKLPSSSSLKHIESENTKKLIEVSSRDPRRKARQVELAMTSPLSPGTASPIPDTGVLGSNSPYYSEDSRDRPYKKKNESKEKKRTRERDKNREERHSKRPYKVKSISQDVVTKSKDNGQSVKQVSDQIKSIVETESLFSDKSLPQERLLADELITSRLTAETGRLRQKGVSGHKLASEPLKSLLPLTNELHSVHLEKENPKTHPPEVQSDSVTILPSSDSVDLSTSARSKFRDPRMVVESPRVVADICPLVTENTNASVADSCKHAIVDEDTTFSNPESSNVEERSQIVVDPFNLNKSSDVSLKAQPGSSSSVAQDVDSVMGLSTDLNSENSFDVFKDKAEVNIVDEFSSDTVSTEPSAVKATEGLVPEEQMVQRDDNFCFDQSSQLPTNKRKLDLEEDNEKHKKRLMSDLIESESGSPMSVGSATELSSLTDERNRVVSPPSAPPPPSIPPLVSSAIENTEVLSEKELEIPKPVIDIMPSSPTLATSEESGKDVDLRLLLPRPVERVQEEIKVEKTELDPMTLFGGEDVDYRQKPPQTADFNMPSPPPPPVISNLQEPVSKKSWAQIKDRKSEERTPKAKPDRSKRSSITQGRPSPSTKGISRQDSETHCNILIKDAEEQLRNGNISFVEYNRMLQEVVSINEERILKEAKASYSNNSFSQDDSRLQSPCQEPEETSFEKDRADDLINQREQNRVGEPIGIPVRLDPPIDPRSLPLEPPLLPDEPFRRDRFDFPDRRIVSDMRDRQPLPAPPNVVDNFSRTRPQMQTCPPFGPPNIPFQMDFRPRMPRNIPPTLLPQADMELLLEAERERLDNISIGGQVRQVRFYGSTAVVLLSWDNPREVRFPVDQRSLYVDKRHEFVLGFGDPPTEITIDGMSSFVQLGAPTREIYIDNKFVSVQFGGRPMEVLMCGRVRSICLSGPPPIVRFGPVKRTDLVAGSVTLYVNAKSNFQFHLDAKPQKFHIEGESCVLQFADNLQTVLINGVPVPLEFGGFPVPVMFRGIMHFLRLTCLPFGIVPGQISILNMETFAQPPSSVMMPLPIAAPPVIEPTPPPPQMFLPTQAPPAPASLLPLGVQRPVDVLASMMNPPSMALSSSDNSYSVEPPAAPVEEEPQQPETTVPIQETPANLNINDLFQKLIQTGILHGTTPAPVVQLPEVKAPPEVEADFYKPETLKLARPALVSKLYSGIQCSSCGIRFPPEGTKMYSRHLDWHFRQNKREKHSTKKPQCRGWYYDLSNWMQYQELEDPDENDPEHLTQDKEEEVEEDMPCVPVGHLKDVACRVCRERFEEFFDHETEDWQARNALHVEDSFYHPLCYEEFKKKQEQEGDLVIPPDEEDEGPPLEDRSIEYIDLDDTEVPSPVPSPDGESLPLLGLAESPDIIAIDDISDDKSEIETDVKDEGGTAPQDYTSGDDDILDIIPIERKIESVELLDDDDEDKPPTDNGIGLDSILDNENAHGTPEDGEFDFTTVKVKVEKDRVNPDNVDSSLPTYTATIDGNIVHETAAPLVIPRRIKINIHRMAKHSESDNLVDSGSESNDMLSLSQPPPPGEETVEPPAASLKAKLVGVELSQQPPLDQGVECSGLCSIM